MRNVSCDINFPYNWGREFYCGERLQLSVELQCTRTVAVRGVILRISCRNIEGEPNDQYGRYIDDNEDNVDSVKAQTEFNTDVDLIENEDKPVQLAPGTHIFNVDSHLPDRIREQICQKDDQLSLSISVIVKKFPTKQKLATLAINHNIKRQTNLTWPGSFEQISSYSNVRVDIKSFHVTNLDRENNRLCCLESEEEFMENWLGAIQMQGEISDEDS